MNEKNIDVYQTCNTIIHHVRNGWVDKQFPNEKKPELIERREVSVNSYRMAGNLIYNLYDSNALGLEEREVGRVINYIEDKIIARIKRYESSEKYDENEFGTNVVLLTLTLDDMAESARRAFLVKERKISPRKLLYQSAKNTLDILQMKNLPVKTPSIISGYVWNVATIANPRNYPLGMSSKAEILIHILDTDEYEIWHAIAVGNQEVFNSPHLERNIYDYVKRQRPYFRQKLTNLCNKDILDSIASTFGVNRGTAIRILYKAERDLKRENISRFLV